LNPAISPTQRRRLDIQGFECVDDATLAPVARWLRLAFGLCTLIAGIGTLLASPAILLALVPIALLAALFPIHPFDLLYNHGIRFLTGTGPLPRRGAPARFACGVAAAWLPLTAFAFANNHPGVGYTLGATLVAVGALVSTRDICIPSLMFRSIFGFPPRRDRSG
jgi:hypothetical protein